MKKVNILGVKIDSVTMDQAYDFSMDILRRKDGFHYIFTPNSEMIMAAKDKPQLKEALNSADLLIADGIGVVYASRIIKDPVPERVTGFDLTQKLLEGISKEGRSAYFFGGAAGVAEEAAANLEKEFPGIQIVGCRNGYFKPEEEDAIVEDINRSGADLLLVCLGAEKQEMWICRYRDRLKVSLALGVGGTLDGIAGRVQRAPEFYQKHGLEWFYRLMKQPNRFVRMLALPKFGLYVLFRGKKYRKEENSKGSGNDGTSC